MSVIATKIQSPAKTEVAPATEVKAETVKSEVKMEDLLARIVKLEGAYDNGYGAPKDKTPPPASAEEEAKPYQVPGVKGEEAKDKGDGSEKPKDTKVEGNYGDHYVAPKAEEEDHEEPDGDECECSQCKGTGKMKKAKEAKKEEKKAEEEDEGVMPKKAEFALDFGKVGQLFKPTKEELETAKMTHFDKNALFGITKKESNSIGHKMTAWAISETQRLTPKK